MCIYPLCHGYSLETVPDNYIDKQTHTHTLPITLHFTYPLLLLIQPFSSPFPSSPSVCTGPPPYPGEYMRQYYSGGDVWGAVVTYTCSTHFLDGNKSVNVTCEEGNWTLSDLPQCKGECCKVILGVLVCVCLYKDDYRLIYFS